MSLVCDLVAAQLYPSDDPSTHQPVAVEGDGNCSFRAASVTLTGCEKDHVKLRQNVCEQLEEQAEAVASSILSWSLQNHD